MDGDIWIESEMGKGSTFFFKVRLDIENKAKFCEFTNAFDKWGMKVLLVEGNAKRRKKIDDILKRQHFDVTTCDSEEEAIKLLKESIKQNQYELVIISDILNKLNGIELVMQIKGLFSIKNKPEIIILHDYNRVEIVGKAEKLGVAATLFKPIKPSLLLNTIMKVFGKEGFEQTSAVKKNETETQILSDLYGIPVLLVEDNEINQEVANDILTSVGMMVTIANNGKDAVDMVKSSSYDIVLMDIQMPVMDGYDATRAIRKDPAYSELPIIAMTANAALSNHEKCLRVGMNDFVSKPIDTKELFEKIKRLTTLDINKKTSAIEEKSNLKEEAFPALEGIDVESALSRLGGNQKLYRKLLTKFHSIHKYDIAEIKKAVDQDDYKTAEIITHTLKGAAGNLGAKAVYLASSNLENELKSFEQEQLKPLIDHLEQVMVQVIDTIASIEQGPEDKDTTTKLDEVNIADMHNSLEGLMKLIEDHDMEAADYLESIIVGLKDPAWSSLFVAMSEKLEQYDFDAAKHHLSVIRSKLRKEGARI